MVNCLFRTPFKESSLLSRRTRAMSYDHKVLFQTVSECLYRSPCISLGGLSRELGISRRTIQKSINTATGRPFRDLREDILISRVRSLFISRPTLAIKELSFDVGYKSARSFARAIKRVCGICPEELRSSFSDAVITIRDGSIPAEERFLSSTPSNSPDASTKDSH
jgi:AraC-like DNA-binding protein